MFRSRNLAVALTREMALLDAKNFRRGNMGTAFFGEFVKRLDLMLSRMSNRFIPTWSRPNGMTMKPKIRTAGKKSADATALRQISWARFSLCRNSPTSSVGWD
jgi:hypothetical protein